MTYASEVLADSPRIYWRLNDPSGTSAVDSSGGSRNGTYNGSPTLGATGLLVGDPSDTAVQFDGVDDYASASDTVSLSAYTAEAWVKLTATPGGTGATILAKYSSTASARLFVLYVTSGRTLSAQFYESTGLSTNISGSVLTLNTTYHVVVTFTGGTGRIYLNGSLNASGSRAGTLSSAAIPFNAGAQPGPTALFAGTIDEAAFYPTALSAARIGDHYTAGTTAPAPITIHPNKITSTGTVRAPSIVPYVAPVDGNITIAAELAPARWSAAATQPNRSAEVQPARLTAGVKP